MMKLLIRFSFVFFILVGFVNAQSTVVSGTIVDPLGNTWSAGTVTAIFQRSPSNPFPPIWSGGSFNQTPATVNMDSGGNFTIALPSNTTITPSGSTWYFSVCPNATLPCAVLNASISGTTFNMETAINNANAWPTVKVPPTPIAKLYNVNETYAPPLSQGGMAYNTTTQQILVYTNTGWQPFASVGGLPVITNPAGNQTVTQPINTNFNFITSGTGVVSINSNPVIYNNYPNPMTFLSSVSSTNVTAPDINNNIYVFPLSGTFDVSTGLATAAASAACGGSGQGCTIHIADGGYTSISWGSNVIVANNNVHIICDSRVPMTFGPGFSSDALDFTGTNDEVEGCTWDASNMSNHIVVATAAPNVRIHGITIKDSKTPSCCSQTLGIRLEVGTVQADVYDNIVTVSYIAYSTSDSALYSNFHDNTSNHSFQCFDFNGSGGGANPDSYGITFHHNLCINDFAPGYVESASDVLIDGNQFWNDGTTANGATIQVHNTITTNYHLHVLVSNNIMIGGGTINNAFHVFQNANDWTFSNNTVRNYNGDAVVVDSTSGSPSNGTIQNNRFTDNGQSGFSNSAIRLLQSAGNSNTQLNIVGNTCIDDTGVPVQPFCLLQTGGGNPALGIQVIGNYSLGGSAPITFTSFGTGCTGCNINTPFLNTSNIYSNAVPIAYSGTFSATAGTTAVLGTGFTGPGCTVSGMCSALSGSYTIGTGTGITAGGMALQLNLPTRPFVYTCTLNLLNNTTTPPTPIATANGNYSTGGVSFEVPLLAASSSYLFTYVCP